VAERDEKALHNRRDIKAFPKIQAGSFNNHASGRETKLFAAPFLRENNKNQNTFFLPIRRHRPASAEERESFPSQPMAFWCQPSAFPRSADWQFILQACFAKCDGVEYAHDNDRD